MKQTVISGRRAVVTVLGVGALVGGASAAAPGAAPAPTGTPASGPVGCAHRPAARQVKHGPAGRRLVALTFDDGPAPATARILDVLEREHVPATFFIVGANVVGREAVLRRMLADGDMIGNHSFDHVSLARSDAAAARQIEDTQDAIVAATGFRPCLLRPPYGRSGSALVALAGRNGLTSVLWSVNPQDFRRPGSSVIVKRVLAGAKPGAIVLSHDGDGVRGPDDRGQTVTALPRTIHGLKVRGYRFVTVTDLLGLKVLEADGA